MSPFQPFQMNEWRGAVFVLSITYWLAASVPALAAHVHYVQSYQNWLCVYLLLATVVSGVSSKLTTFRTLRLVPSSATAVLETLGVVILTRVLAKAFTLLFNVNFLLLFKATTFTMSLGLGIAALSPWLLLLIVPVLKRVSWYYCVAYCGICGGAVLLSGIGSMFVLGLAWKHTVSNSWLSLLALT